MGHEVPKDNDCRGMERTAARQGLKSLVKGSVKTDSGPTRWHWLGKSSGSGKEKEKHLESSDGGSRG